MVLQKKSEQGYSLQKRLLLAFGILLILFLGLAGFVLDRAFKESVAASVEERLQLQIYALLGVAEPEGEGFFVPDMEEARFSQIDSGLYGFILDSNGRELWRSMSALNFRMRASALVRNALEPGETFFGSLETEEQGPMSYASYGTFWPNQDEEFSFVVMETVAPTAAEISEFQSSLWFWLGGLALLLSLAQYYLLRWGLFPLQRLAEDVARIESGASDALEPNYPTELRAVTDNLNLLIKSERERQSRYRTTLGDLAHSLKTPLAVISGIVQQVSADKPVTSGTIKDVSEQLERMDQIVSYQLKRAVKSNHARILAKPVQIKPVIEKILPALNKVYRDKEVNANTALMENARFFGDEKDLMELCGNLLDNAFKYCRSEISVAVSEQGNRLVLAIDDDGEGIPEQEHKRVLERGARADTLKSGQGIGLAVSMDIISAYGGTIEMGKSALGGASIRVLFEREP
ncbi:MAG: ATP-binding protein [Pseudomonadales bacterium]|nr:ATP-binding protein [Pseudomonadales bacterium]